MKSLYDGFLSIHERIGLHIVTSAFCEISNQPGLEQTKQARARVESIYWRSKLSEKPVNRCCAKATRPRQGETKTTLASSSSKEGRCR